MAKYNLYAGLGGGFGGYQYHCTEDFDTKEEALDAARELAIEEYQSYEGSHGLRSLEEIKEDYIAEYGIEEEEFHNGDWSAIEEEYMEEVEGWLSYLVTTVEEDPEHDRYYKW